MHHGRTEASVRPRPRCAAETIGRELGSGYSIHRAEISESRAEADPSEGAGTRCEIGRNSDGFDAQVARIGAGAHRSLCAPGVHPSFFSPYFL